MDTNGTRFHLRLGERDWAEPIAAPESRNVTFDLESGSVTLERVVQMFPDQVGAAPLTEDARRGADCDRFGNWYWIDTDRRGIRTVRSGRTDASDYWHADQLDAAPCPEDNADALFAPAVPAEPDHADLTLWGLAVTTGHYLVVSTRDPAGILVFDLHGPGPPVFQRWPEEIGFRPFDMARSREGGILVLENAGTPSGPGPRYWQLDRQFRPMPTDRTVELSPPGAEMFHSAGEAGTTIPAVTFPDGFSADLGSPAPAPNPRAIVGLPDGSVLILDTGHAGPSTIARFDRETPLGSVVLDPALLGKLMPPPAELRGHDMAFLLDPEHDGSKLPEFEGDLVVVSENGNQAFRFRLRAGPSEMKVTLLPDYLPLRRYDGRALVVHEGKVYYDLGERWLALVASPRRRYRPDGVLAGLVFDGKTPGCVWHRLVFDGCVPAGAEVSIESRVADDLLSLADRPWLREREPYRRSAGPETPPRMPFSADGTPTAGSGSQRWGAWETLFQSATGRYLELRLTIFGGGRLSPYIHALRVHYPRFSYLERYLPAIYRDDPVSASFLDRFLANPEGFFTVLEDRVAASQNLFDTRTAPGHYLDWLAGWLGGTLDADWEDWRRRLFIDNAELLFRWRGTVAGLRALLSLATEDCPNLSLFDELRSGQPSLTEAPGRELRIVESFLLRRFGGVELGDPEAGVGGGLPTIPGGAAWTPDQGAAALHQRFRDFVLERYVAETDPLTAIADAWGRPLDSAEAISLSPIEPEDNEEAADWRAFISGPIGFVYWPATDDDERTWRSFLERRYRRISRLNTVWQRVGSAAFARFEDVGIPGPGDFPIAGARLADWIAFVSRVLPVAATAHRFTVLVPIGPDETGRQRMEKIDKVRALVECEKPAHTLFEVRPFWALFQVGSARLGLDTVLGEGSRFAAIELSRSALAEGHLAYGHPWSVTDRAVVGRDNAGGYPI